MIAAKERLQKWLGQLVILNDMPYWVAAMTVGLFAVGYARLFVWAEGICEQLLRHHPWFFVLLCPLFFMGSWALVYFIAPEAKGSGIPQVMVSIKRLETNRDGGTVSQLLGLRTILVKVASSILCILGGGAIGREGPTVQISAAVFHFFSQKLERFTRFKANKELWLITGGAAGIAAAFNTPLGGIVYAIEELATSHFNRFKTSLISAVIISGLASQWVSGPYLYLGFPKLRPTDLGIIPWTILVSICCGLAGSFFGKLLFQVSLRAKEMTNRSHLLIRAGACGLAIALIAIFLDAQAIGSGKDTVLHFLFAANKESSWTLPVVRFVTPIISYFAGTAGGVFAPSLAAGGTLGYWFGQLMHPDHSNLFVLLGMIAFLTAVTHAPFTAFVLVLEMTDRHSAIFPMMLSALVASQVARLHEPRSLYESIAEAYLKDGAPSDGEASAGPVSTNLGVSEGKKE